MTDTTDPAAVAAILRRLRSPAYWMSNDVPREAASLIEAQAAEIAALKASTRQAHEAGRKAGRLEILELVAAMDTLSAEDIARHVESLNAESLRALAQECGNV